MISCESHCEPLYIYGVMLMTEINWLTEPEAAKLLGVSLATLRRMRAAGIGPAWHRIGHAVKYQREEIDRFIEESRQK